MSVLTFGEYNLDLHIPQKSTDSIFFSLVEKEELSFISENNGSLIS